MNMAESKDLKEELKRAKDRLKVLTKVRDILLAEYVSLCNPSKQSAI